MSYNTQMLKDLQERLKNNSGRTQKALIQAMCDEPNENERKAMEIIWLSNDEDTTDEMWEDIFDIIGVDFKRSVKSDSQRMKNLRDEF